MENRILGCVFILLSITVLSNQNQVNADDELIRAKRQFFNDFDGGIFDNGNYLDGENAKVLQERQFRRLASSKPRRIKTDPDFNRRLAQLQQKFTFSPFLQAYAKYFVRNREQKRERREIDENSFYENSDNGAYNDYYAQEEEYRERRHRFHPIPVF